MRVLKIKKNGKLFIEESVENEIVVTKTNSLKAHLACEVEFEKGLTFGTFLKLIFKEKAIFDIVFNEELNGKKIKYFEEQMDEPQEKIEEDFKLEFLEISKIFELFTFDKGSTIDLFSVFIGIGKTTDNFDVYIPISLFSVSELKDLEIIPNKLVEIYREVDLSPLDEEEVEDDEEDIEEDEVEDENISFFEAATRITLYEAIQSVLYEISFHKTEEERITVRKNQNNEQMNKNKIAILELQLSKHIDNEDFEKAAGIKRELDKLKNLFDVSKN